MAVVGFQKRMIVEEYSDLAMRQDKKWRRNISKKEMILLYL